MKKMKLISSLTSLGVVAGAVPVVATACDSGSSPSVDNYVLSNAENANISGSTITVVDNTKDALVTFSYKGKSDVLFYIEGTPLDGYTFTNNSTTLRVAANTAAKSGDKMNIKNSYKTNESMQITVRANTNPDPKPEEEEVVPGYSIACKTADENNLLTTQPGQFEKFVLSYYDTPYTVEEEPYIFWSVETLSGDTSVNPVFMDNYIYAPGCGYLYCSYLNTGTWMTGTRTKIKVTASNYETGKILARKTLEITRAERTFYTPKGADLTLMNTLQFVPGGTQALSLKEDKEGYPDVEGVQWTLERDLSTLELAGIMSIDTDGKTLKVASDVDVETKAARTGYITLKATIPNFNKPLYFCVNCTVGRTKINYELLPETTPYKIPNAPYEYCDYFFIPEQTRAQTQATPLFNMKYDAIAGEGEVGGFTPYWSVSLKKSATKYVAGFTIGTATDKDQLFKLNANYENLKTISYYSGIVYLYNNSGASRILAAMRYVVISIVDQDTFDNIEQIFG